MQHDWKNHIKLDRNYIKDNMNAGVINPSIKRTLFFLKMCIDVNIVVSKSHYS